MFSTFLKEIKDIFNKWALISAFYPSLIFWTLAAIFVLSKVDGWNEVQQKLNRWDQKALVMLAYFVWISFWTFLTINLQPALVRLFEGHWHVKALSDFRRRFWQQRWDEKKKEDLALEREQVTLYRERKGFDSLRKPPTPLSNEAELNEKSVDEFLKDINTKLEKHGETDSLAEDVNDAWRYWNISSSPSAGRSVEDVNRRSNLEALGRRLARLERQLERKSDAFIKTAGPELSGNQIDLTPERLEQLGRQARKLWRSIQLYADSPFDGIEWMTSRQKSLNSIMNMLQRMVKTRQDEVEEQRSDHNREFLLYYPPGKDDVMPTRLGNVLKGADKRIYHRYQLDPAIIWSRLQPQLAKEFAEGLQNVKGPFDLMITLSSFSIFFGILLSSYESIHLGKPWLIVALVIIIPLLSSHKIASRIAIVALILFVIWTFAVPLNVRAPAPPASISQFKVLSLLIAASCSLAWLTYENAVQACIVYCEKIQTAFDLYRWKVLEEMHLQAPPNFEEEREIWKDVCGMLYRSERPRPPYYRYVSQDKKIKEAVQPLTHLFAPQKNLPPYHCITAGDISEIEIPEAQVPVDAVRKSEDFIGKSSLKMLAGGAPVPRSCLIDTSSLKETVAIGIQADVAKSVGGNLSPGARIDLIILPPVSTAASTTSEAAAKALTPTIIEDTLILDIKNTTDTTKLLLVVAIPLSRKAEYLENINGTFLIMFKPGSQNSASSR